MSLSRNKLYSILSITSAGGYIWLYYGFINTQGEKDNLVEVCLFKHITNIPCPSCGSTRSVLSLLHGNFLESLYINPFGMLIALIMLLTPVWLLYDISTRKNTLLDFYLRLEAFLRKPIIAIPLIILVLINWIWNITKDL